MSTNGRRREYVPSENEQPQAQPIAQSVGEDVQLALDTLERRIAHLSALINPAPGQRPHRTAHWRDEVELRSLRISVKALRAYRGDNGAALVAMLTRIEETLQHVLDSGALPVRQQEQIRRLAEDMDVLLEAME